MSKIIKQRKKFYSPKEKQWIYKIIETTEIKALCEKKSYCERGKLHAVDEAITDLDEWYGLDDVTDERVIEEIEWKMHNWLSNFYDCHDTRYEIRDKKSGFFREMTEQEMSREVERTKKFITKLKGLL